MQAESHASSFPNSFSFKGLLVRGEKGARTSACFSSCFFSLLHFVSPPPPRPLLLCVCV